MKTHGLKHHPLYGVWSGMIQRCEYTKKYNYHNYGGRGITICKEWRNDFKSFHDWCLENGWQKGLTLDRVDTDGNYSPENCRVVTFLVQHNNKRNTHMITHNGETRSISDWCRLLGLKYPRTRQRITNLKWPVEKAFLNY